MNLLKDDKTAQFDELTRVADETLDLYRDLAHQLEDGELHAILTRHIEEQSELLDELRRRRRAHDDLPQAGDPEFAHLHAALAQVRAYLLPGKSERHVAESLIETTAHLRREIDKAQAWELAPDESRLLPAYEQTCRSLERVLHKRLDE